MKSWPVKYAKDCLEKKNLGEIVDGFAFLLEQKASEETLLNYLDREFIHGAWGAHLETIPRLFLNDVRGFIIALGRKNEL